MLCRIVGAPVGEGSPVRGCEMGPVALRRAGLARALSELGHLVEDIGSVTPEPVATRPHANPLIKHLPEIAAWTEALAEAAYLASDGALPIFLGGDHAMAAGTISGMARRARRQGRPFFVLWLDAHADFHTLDSTESGNLHGVPLAYVCGQPGFEGYFPRLAVRVEPENLCVLGVRSAEASEWTALKTSGATTHDMRAIETHGVATLLEPFLEKVAALDGFLHVSLDADFLDPASAPGVGTAVEGGPDGRTAHLVMQILAESGLLASLDIAELNPFLDEDGRTARLLIDLSTRLFGRAARAARRYATS